MLATSSPNQQPKLILVEMLLTETSSRFTRTSSLQLLSLSGGITRTQGMYDLLHIIIIISKKYKAIF